LDNDGGKFKLNKKELDYVLQQLINLNATSTKDYDMVIKKVTYFLGGDYNDAQFERILYILKFCMKHRKINFDIDIFIEVMNERLFKFLTKTIVDKELTEQKDYDKIILSDICGFIKIDYYDYRDNENDNWLIKILEFCGKYRGFNLKHFQKLSSSILAYYRKYDNEYDNDGSIKNDNIAAFVRKILKKEYIDVNETQTNIKEIHKILLNIYNEIFDKILFLIYEKSMTIELHYHERKELKLLMRHIIQNINKIIINFNSNDFQDKDIKKSLLLDINSVDADYNWRSSGKYDGISPPRNYIQKIILGDDDTLRILQKHNAYDNVKYLVTDFQIVN